MYRALTADQSRAAEQSAVDAGTSLAALMRAAGAAVAAEVAERVPAGTIVVLAGPGNNGGDGWVAARELAVGGRNVVVLSTRDPQELSGIAAEAAAETIAADVVSWRVPDRPPTSEDLAGAAAVVDALLGTGSTAPLRAPLDEWVSAVNECGAYVISVDLPTGVDSDSGLLAGPAIQADCTVTFTAPKLGLVLYPAAGRAGEVVVADIGIEHGAADFAHAPEVWSVSDYAALLPLPAVDAHKNQRGRVLVIAGSAAYPGAAVLAARGAMRSGAGYVTLAVPSSVVPVAQAHLQAVPVVGLPQGHSRALSSAALEKALQLAKDHDAVVLGPGLTQVDGAVVTVRGLVSRLETPLVVDADALNALVDAHELIAQRTAPTVLTPHPGELGRLLGMGVEHVQRDRIEAAAELAGPARAVVLKGAGTVTSIGRRAVINTSGTPALATAGTGDVLAGVIGALLAQGLTPLEAGALGAYLHGRAGEAAAADLTPLCVTAEDVPDYLPAAVAELLQSW